MRRFALALAATLSAGACASPTAPAAGPKGRFVLRSVDGVSLPYALLTTESTSVVIAGRTLHLDGIGGFEDIVTLRLSDRGEVATATTRRRGTIRTDGARLSLRYDDKPEARGEWSTSVVRLHDGGMVFEFGR